MTVQVRHELLPQIMDNGGFQFADKLIPEAWIAEPADQRRLDAITTASAS